MSDVASAPPPSTPAGQHAVRAEGVSKIYGRGDTEVLALNHVSIEFERGKFNAIMGPSGSGKSTLMHCLAGLDSINNGSVFIGDARLGDLRDKKLTLLRRERVGFIFQQFNLVPTLNAEENIKLPMQLARKSPDEAWFKKVVDMVDLGDRLKHRPSELSGGQQQRVAVARALLSKPEIIFADEPTGNLDSKSGAEVLKFMKQAVQELGQTIVMVTHDPFAASYADRVVFLVDGKIVDDFANPTADQILDHLRKLGG